MAKPRLLAFIVACATFGAIVALLLGKDGVGPVAWAMTNPRGRNA